MKALKMPDWRLVLTLVGCSALVVGAMAAEPARPKAAAPGVPGLVQYLTPAGEHFAALVLPAPAAPALKAVPHDHVLIVDTSASQTGPFRTRSLSIATAFANALPEGDRLLLLAADVSADDLTFGFAAANSAELSAGLERLNDRVPLGSSNLELALRTALKSFKGNRSRSVLFVGDGYSTAQLIQSPTMHKLVTEMRDASVPVNSFGVGPRVDVVLLGTLAQHTGGVVTLDEPTVVADRGSSGTDTAKMGRDLVQAARLPVFYPDRIATKPTIDKLQPTALPPVRFDRETVLLGRGLSSNKVSIRMSGTLAGQPKDYSWNLESEKLGGSAGFVFQAWKMSDETHGVAMPLAGRALLMKQHNAFQSQVEALTDAGATLLGRRDLRQAEQVAQSLQQLDPASLTARHIMTSSNKLKAQPVKRQRVRVLAQADPAEEKTPEENSTEEKTTEEKPAEAATEEAKPAGEEKPADEAKPAAEEKPEGEEKPAAEEKPAGEEKPATEETPAEKPETDTKPDAEAKPATEAAVEGEPAMEAEPMPAPSKLDTGDASNPKPGTLLEELTNLQEVRIQQMTEEVNLAIAEATKVAKVDFGIASDQLKELIRNVDGAVDLPESIRLPLRRRLDSTLQKLQNENEAYVQASAALRTKQSQIEAMKKLTDQAQRDEERMQQLIERVRALITRGVKGEATAFEEAEEYARIAVELDPYNYVPNLDVFNSEAFGALDQARRLRAMRADKFLAVMYEVERAHVPFPDEPPVLWPSAERWREITIKREKWKSVDLKNYSKQEEKIVAALNKPMTEKFDFVDATLEDVRNKLVEVYGINVIIDKAKLEEDAVQTDAADINLVISDILLKNALKLVLEPKNLTYSVQDEVLKITTKTDTKGKMPIKAVYAGDLATPVNPLFGQGGSGAGGQQGGGQQLNGQQQGGGFGGGAGGFGGGGGGGFGGGGGGNFFNVPPSKPNPVGNGFQPKPEVQPKPVLPKPAKAKDEVGAVRRPVGQAFAQVQDNTSKGALNGETLSARKKKPLTAR